MTITSKQFIFSPSILFFIVLNSIVSQKLAKGLGFTEAGAEALKQAQIYTYVFIFFFNMNKHVLIILSFFFILVDTLSM
jgi:hypothetical protein